jgi:hypothetical protein
VAAVDVIGEDFHVLGYGIDHTDPLLARRLHDWYEDRARRIERMAAWLTELGLPPRSHRAGRAPRQRLPDRTPAPRGGAARAQLVDERLAPWLDEGTWTCSTASSTPRWPTRAAGAASASTRSAALNAFATGGLSPDRTLLLRTDPATACARRRDTPDRLEREQGSGYLSGGHIQNLREVRRSSRV